MPLIEMNKHVFSIGLKRLVAEADGPGKGHPAQSILSFAALTSLDRAGST
jgi:hypothetical protein